MKRLAILGASGHGKVLADMAELVGWGETVFFDDAWPGLEKAGQWRVEGDTRALTAAVAAYDGVIVAIGDNLVRLDKQRLLAESGGALVSLIHPQASVSRYASIGAGSVVMAGAVINVDAHVGKGCIINTGATVDHDCELGDGVHLSPGVHLAGGVKVGRASWIGIGASVKQLVSIGDGVVVGAGAAVVQNLPDRCTALGVPARIVGSA
ncbi:acetyltransferase [Marinobacterium aestuarii]|uniref:Acetyltransferase n=1 Tax=Marinobacterium aestuarii TaxID=1821621 RepID=A0A1A9EV72_9GAMM|nr:acetyltransferase [Marinobacterium aestuarii]ANG61795.1 acetyltransferase [Marinobacterium aestuarii]